LVVLQWTFYDPYVDIAYLTQNISEKFESLMWVLRDGNVAKCTLMIMDVSIAQLAKKTSEKFGSMIQLL
jgi:hypothetical protein